jgi:hypothetical protein
VADSPNTPGSDAKDQKMDLKTRLALKSKAAAAPPPSPVIPNAVLPPPPPKPPEAPTAESIEAARRRAAEADRDAGPAVEQFTIGAPDKTPLPAKLPQEPQIRYVEVPAAAASDDDKRKRRNAMIGAALGAGIVFFFVGQMVAGMSASSEQRESVLREAQEKAELLKDKQATFDAISTLRLELEKVDIAVRGLDKDGGDITTLEKEFAALIGAMGKFAESKVTVIDPDVAMGEKLVNSDLMKEVLGLAYATKIFHGQVVAALEEAKALFSANPVPPPSQQSMLLISEPDEREVEGVGKVPLSKGTIVIQPGPPQATEGKDGSGNTVTEYLQKVKVEGREEPVLIKTTQLVQLDLQPFYANVAKNSKKAVLGRLAVIANRLLEQSKALDPKAVRTKVEEVIDLAGGKKAE